MCSLQVPLEPCRTVNVFRERVEKHKDELAELDILENIPDREKPVRLRVLTFTLYHT